MWKAAAWVSLGLGFYIVQPDRIVIFVYWLLPNSQFAPGSVREKALAQ